jgi:hypothetical protein
MVLDRHATVPWDLGQWFDSSPMLHLISYEVAAPYQRSTKKSPGRGWTAFVTKYSSSRSEYLQVREI